MVGACWRRTFCFKKFVLRLDLSDHKAKQKALKTEELCHHFSLADLRKSTNNFDEKLIVAKGDNSMIYKGCLEHNGSTDHIVAIKRMAYFNEFKKEIELLCQLRHPNLISLIGFCNHKDEKIIVYEYTHIGSLHHYMHNKDTKPLSWKKRLEICIGVARGLQYLHSGAKRSIFHLNIKPQNILLDKDMMPKLIHYQVSLQGPLSTSKPKPITADNVVVVCTKDKQMFMNKANMLPNQQWEKRAGECSEFFDDPTLHMILFLKRFPVEEIIDPILTGKIAPECWEVFRDITQRCLKGEPDERPTMGEVEMLLERALSLQEEADIREIDGGGYTLLTATSMDQE